MRLRPEKLAAQLERRLAPVYLLTGDEPLTLLEAADAIRVRAREAGYSERVVLEADNGFDWGRLEREVASPSLFAERRLIDLRIPGGKPGQEGGRALAAFAADAGEETLLLITAGRIDSRSQKAKWFRAIDEAGVILQARPLDLARLVEWIAARMRARGLQPSREAAEVLAARVEGNQLAAAQEVEKLALILEPGPVGAEQVAEAVSDSARFNIFQLGDAALAGDARRCARILRGLREEGVALPLVLWALTRETRHLVATAGALARRQSPDRVLAGQRVWQSRIAAYRRAAARRRPADWQRLLRRCAELDRAIKGVGEGCVVRGGRDACAWDGLLDVALGIAGQPLPLESTNPNPDG